MHDLNVTNNKNQRRITLSNQRRTRQSTNQKSNHVGRMFRGNSRREAYSKENSSIEYTQNATTNCNGFPTEDWQRGQNVAAIKKHNAKNEQRREYPKWNIESEDQYMITKTAHSQTNNGYTFSTNTTDATPGMDQNYTISPPSPSKNNSLLLLWIKPKTPTTNNSRHSHPKKIPTAPIQQINLSP